MIVFVTFDTPWLMPADSSSRVGKPALPLETKKRGATSKSQRRAPLILLSRCGLSLRALFQNLVQFSPILFGDLFLRGLLYLFGGSVGLLCRFRRCLALVARDQLVDIIPVEPANKSGCPY